MIAPEDRTSSRTGRLSRIAGLADATITTSQAVSPSPARRFSLLKRHRPGLRGHLVEGDLPADRGRVTVSASGRIGPESCAYRWRRPPGNQRHEPGAGRLLVVTVVD